MQFVKMHGIGNDFLIFDARETAAAPLPPAVVRSLADRHFGVGFDQMVVLSPGDREADAVLAFWNADGSESGACGNATRCAGDLLLREQGATTVRLRTASGLLCCERMDDGTARVDMGVPKLHWREIPLAEERDTRSFASPASASAVADCASAVSMGNPHCVFFVEDVEQVPIEEVGPGVERDALFPERANVSFAEVLDKNRIRLRVWERGAGATFACGSAACATLVAGVRRNLTDRSVDIEFQTGALRIDWFQDESNVRMSGPSTTVFRGEMDAGFLREQEIAVG